MYLAVCIECLRVGTTALSMCAPFAEPGHLITVFHARQKGCSGEVTSQPPKFANAGGGAVKPEQY